MKFTINKALLLPPLQKTVGVVEKKQTMPILSNILLTLSDNKLILTSTDLEIQLTTIIHFDCNHKGAITVPARKLLDIVKLLPDEASIKFELIENTPKKTDTDTSESVTHKLKISSGRSRFSLSTLCADNYPNFSESELDNQFSINAGTFKQGLDKTIFCMGNNDVRYYLNGLLLYISHNKFTLVASDGHRLSCYENDIGMDTGYEIRIILPRKGVLELSRLLDDDELELNIHFSNNNIKIYVHDYIFSAKLIDAKYPDFAQVFNTDDLLAINIQKNILREALTRVAILANEKFKGVTCHITDNLLKLNSHNQEHDEAEEDLLIEYTGNPLSVAFNPQYLLDAINNLESQLVVLTITKDGGGCLLGEPESKPYKFIVMPMRL